MAKSSKAAAERQEVVLQIPDMGLSPQQIASLKKTFKNELVSSMGEKVAARPRLIIVRIRIVFGMKEV